MSAQTTVRSRRSRRAQTCAAALAHRCGAWLDGRRGRRRRCSLRPRRCRFASSATAFPSRSPRRRRRRAGTQPPRRARSGELRAVPCGPDAAVRFAGDVGPSLAGVGARFSVPQLRLRVADNLRVHPTTIMPSYYRIDGLARVASAYRGKPILTRDRSRGRGRVPRDAAMSTTATRESRTRRRLLQARRRARARSVAARARCRRDDLPDIPALATFLAGRKPRLAARAARRCRSSPTTARRSR